MSESDRSLDERPPRITAGAAVTFGTDRNLERTAVIDERAILCDALVRSMGERTVAEIKCARHAIVITCSTPL